MSDQKHNGWTNYETWITNLWFDNFDFNDQVEDGVFEDMDEYEVTSYVADYIKEYVEEFVGGSYEGYVADLINSSLSEVDWVDIAEHYVSDIMEALN